MKLSEIIKILNQQFAIYGDHIPVKVDHRDFASTLDIASIEVGDTYHGPHAPVLYIYVDDYDAERILEHGTKDS